MSEIHCNDDTFVKCQRFDMICNMCHTPNCVCHIEMFAEKTFTDGHKSAKFTNIFSRKVSHYRVHSSLILIIASMGVTWLPSLFVAAGGHKKWRAWEIKSCAKTCICAITLSGTLSVVKATYPLIFLGYFEELIHSKRNTMRPCCVVVAQAVSDY